MLNSVALEVSIGLVLTFLLFSLILTSLQEGLESLLKGRAKDLECTVRDLLDDPHGSLTQLVYEHPLIFPLFKDSYHDARRVWRRASSNLPSYIPKEAFAAALADVVAGNFTGRGEGKSATIEVSQQVGHVFRLADAGSNGAATAKLATLEHWYDSAMERLSGRYKRKTQLWLFAIGLACAAIGNINPIHIADKLAHDQALRENMIAAAPLLQTQGAPGSGGEAQARQALTTLVDHAGLPIGYPGDDSAWYVMIAGWLVAALAGMLGAPFWFDMLGRLMSIRSAVKPADPPETPHR